MLAFTAELRADSEYLDRSDILMAEVNRFGGAKKIQDSSDWSSGLGLSPATLKYLKDWEQGKFSLLPPRRPTPQS